MTLTPKQKRAPNDFKTAWRSMSNAQRLDVMQWLAEHGGGQVTFARGPLDVVTLTHVRLAGAFK